MGLIGAAAAVVAAIYTFQVVYPRVRDILAPPRDLGERAAELAARYRERQQKAKTQEHETEEPG